MGSRKLRVLGICCSLCKFSLLQLIGGKKKNINESQNLLVRMSIINMILAEMMNDFAAFFNPS